MVKMSFTDNQTAFEYAIYMIAGSYFDKAVCTSKLVETNMFLQYKEQKLFNQYNMEKICIQFMEELNKIFPENFFNQEVEVKLLKNKADSNSLTEICFMNEQYVLSLKGRYAGKESKIDYKIWKKNK